MQDKIINNKEIELIFKRLINMPYIQQSILIEHREFFLTFLHQYSYYF